MWTEFINKPEGIEYQLFPRRTNETYADRTQNGRIGIEKTDAERMFHYYVKPQSTGNRTDMRWSTLTNNEG